MSKAPNRLSACVAELQRKNEKAFCAFLTAGFPNLGVTAKLVAEFEKAGVDILELGYPFSDPLADGPTIQYASQAALEKGICLSQVLKLLNGLRQKGLRLPVVFFTYLNPLLAYGLARFARDARRAGFDAVLVPDMPMEEELSFQAALKREGLLSIYLVTPTTSRKRTVKIAQASEGFIYYVSLRGVTGARQALPRDIAGHLRFLKKQSKKTVLIGFGVSTPEQARRLSDLSDGVIVGSAIIERLRKASGDTKPVTAYVRQMVRAVKQSSKGSGAGHFRT